MCGIFGIIKETPIEKSHVSLLALHARQRGRDSSGLFFKGQDSYTAIRSDYDISDLLAKTSFIDTTILIGHSRLITNGFADNQPIIRDGVVLIHNGIIVNDESVWKRVDVVRQFQIDSEAIIGVALQYLNAGGDMDGLSDFIFSECKGTISCALLLPTKGKLCLLSNNGSLYVGKLDGGVYFSSEQYPLICLGCNEIEQLVNRSLWFDIPKLDSIFVSDDRKPRENLIPSFKNIASEEDMLVYSKHNLRRCSKCILTETMPYISFDSQGVCNYCNNYKLRNNPKPYEDLFSLVEPYRRIGSADCIVPFSGGRDSCWGLHIIVNELKMRPITYTYDWGMVTDLGRRNISRMCSALGVENIIIADDISRKRENIKRNLSAWLKAPNLGMISILTAGDKHFFRHVETVKKQTGINLNLWGVNPLEVTHFKAGFLGVPPDFEERRVYMHGVSKQINYQLLRLRAMLQSPGYFNSSIWDTLSGEYYRSFTEKRDYFHIFDFVRWDENICDKTLACYDWELAEDTNTTWRIGDGTAAFYNYLYYKIAGFTEHDTFRSNQIREGQLTRDAALILIADENRPRYKNIRWYLDAVGLDYSDVIRRVNSIESMY